MTKAKDKPKGKRVATGDGYAVVSKNANGQGSIYLDNKGSYRATYKDPVNGKRRTVTAGTKTEAAARREAKLAEREAEKEAEATKGAKSVLGENPTFAAFAQWWLDNKAPEKARPTTFVGYSQDVRRLNEHLGDLAVTDLDYSTSLAAVSKLREVYGHGTVCNAQARLRQLAGVAVKEGYLAENPATGLPKPERTEAEAKPKRILTPHEVARLLDVLDGTNDLDAGLALLFTNGLRASEVLGLAWPDLNPEAPKAEIMRGLTHTAATGFIIGRTKTPETRRTITLHPLTVKLLEARKEIQHQQRLAAGPAWVTYMHEGAIFEPIFTTLRGELLKAKKLSQALSDRMTKADLDPSRKTHMGRHSAITNLTGDGVPLHEVSDFVGHRNIETTRGYLQDREGRTAAAAATLAELYVVDDEKAKVKKVKKVKKAKKLKAKVKKLKAEAERLKTGTTEAG